MHRFGLRPVAQSAGAQGRFLGFHLPWISVPMPLAGLWTQVYLYGSVPAAKSCKAAVPLGSFLPWISWLLMFSSVFPKICNLFAKRIVLKGAKLLMLGDGSGHGRLVGKGRKGSAFLQLFHHWRNPGTSPVILFKTSVWGSGNYLSHLTKWHSHLCGCA